ncbi:hypothetical protein L5515_019467 [Caenorhabditis briggsae]|uniref:C2H2-type domain-containing protein n=1 Tax=Caenorhabditis briggsae TaxID=6238 RepID=A0AAE9JTT2_CAEBR|nr:hypothetical protein L5515_019467 [Caenorhabditis briggsae]
MDNRIISQRIQCVECPPSGVEYSVEELEAHIASEHLFMNPYQCDKCIHAKFPTEFALVTHNEEQHQIQDFMVTYRYNPELNSKKIELSKMVDRCIDMQTYQAPLQNMDFGFGIFPQSYSTAPIQASMTYNTQKPDVSTTGPERVVRKKDLTKITCEQCQEAITKNRTNMMYHANTRHGKYILFLCKACNRTYTTIAKKDPMKHIQSKHPNPDGSTNYNLLVDNRDLYRSQLRSVMESCFPDCKKKSSLANL